MASQSEVDRLADRLFNDPKRKILNFKVYRGDRPATAEQIAAEVNKALDAMERGDCEIVEAID